MRGNAVWLLSWTIMHFIGAVVGAVAEQLISADSGPLSFCIYGIVLAACQSAVLANRFDQQIPVLLWVAFGGLGWFAGGFVPATSWTDAETAGVVVGAIIAGLLQATVFEHHSVWLWAVASACGALAAGVILIHLHAFNDFVAEALAWVCFALCSGAVLLYSPAVARVLDDRR